MASTEPVILASSRWRSFYELTKPRVVMLIVFTSIVGTLLAVPGMPPLDALIFGNLGVGLAAASAAVINHVLDERIDAVDVAHQATSAAHGQDVGARGVAVRRRVVRAVDGDPGVAGEHADRACSRSPRSSATP